MQIFFNILIILAFTSCTQLKEENIAWEAKEYPVMLFADTTILELYEGTRLSWKVKTAYLERWGGSDSIFVKPIFADIYDSLGNKAAFLRADSGNLNMRMTFMRAYGRVYALSPKGAAVRADSLLWLKQDNKIRTDGPVRVVGETGDVLQGIGFESDAKLENWSIRSSVTGIFQEAAKRLQEEDNKLVPSEETQPATKEEQTQAEQTQAEQTEQPQADTEQ
ncbi:MAG: LPS export ABC transporter periplasmic protein LptC [Fibromonadaceae bacterium]|jgi:LPS export ABC transporter protein LptC|nr:LPS export ABC transporter periplasmic protein LptC [Fibromonadaceae bacterium]